MYTALLTLGLFVGTKAQLEMVLNSPDFKLLRLEQAAQQAREKEEERRRIVPDRVPQPKDRT